MLAEVVDRLDDPETEGAFPEPIDDDFGEARVFGRGEPVTEGMDGMAALAEGRVGSERRRGVHDGEGAGIVVLVVFGQAQGAIALEDVVKAQRKEDLGRGPAQGRVVAFAGVTVPGHHDRLSGAGVGGLTFAFRFCFSLALSFPLAVGTAAGELHRFLHDGVIAGSHHAVGEGGEMVVVHLRPRVEGVIVALRADDLGSEEDLGGDGEVVERHAVVAQVVPGGGIFPARARGGDEFADEVVVGFVPADGVLDPAFVGVPGPDALAVPGDGGAGAEQVGKVIVKMGDISVGSDQ